MRVQEWINGVVNLADPENTPPSTPPVPTPTTLGGQRAEVVSSRSLIPCVPGIPNGQNGRMLPQHVWVPLEILRFDPVRWGGLRTFFGNVQASWWEDDVWWYGIEFGGAIGWRKVAVNDCQTMDWREERPNLLLVLVLRFQWK